MGRIAAGAVELAAIRRVTGAELRDFPVFFQRVSFFPEVPANEAVTDVFLPLR